MPLGNASYTPDTLRAIKEMKVWYKEDRDDTRQRLYNLYYEANGCWPTKSTKVLEWFFANYIFFDEKNMWFERRSILN